MLPLLLAATPRPGAQAQLSKLCRATRTSTANLCAFSIWRDVRCRRFSISARLRLNESARSLTCVGVA